MANRKQNYGNPAAIPVVAAAATGAAGIGMPMVALVGVLLFLIPIFLIGVGGVIMFYKMIFSPIMSGSIPLWAFIAIGVVVIMMIRRKSNPY